MPLQILQKNCRWQTGEDNQNNEEMAPHPVSPWGQLAKGLKTRKKGKSSDTFIVKRRK